MYFIIIDNLHIFNIVKILLTMFEKLINGNLFYYMQNIIRII